MKVMFINSVVDYGSTGKIVRDLANNLKENNHEVLIAYGRHTAIDSTYTFDISSKLGFFYHWLMTKLFDRHGLHSKFATKKLINKIKEFKPDVIHLHNLHGYYLNYPMLLSYLKEEKKIKVVWTLHDLWMVAGSVAHYSYYGCKLYDEGCVLANNPRVYPKSILFLREKKNFYLKKKLMENFENLNIVTVSKWQKKEVEKSYLKNYKINQIYNGLDFTLFQNLKVKKEENLLLGSSTYWNSEKGLDDFIKLAKILPKKYKIALIGLDENKVKNLPKNIEAIPVITDYKKLIKIYAKASIFLNLSVQETMGMTTVEALAAKTPVIVYDQTAVPEIINQNVGIVTKANDIEQLKKQIIKLSEKNIKSDTLYDFAYSNYNKQKMFNEYNKLYFSKD